MSRPSASPDGTKEITKARREGRFRPSAGGRRFSHAAHHRLGPPRGKEAGTCALTRTREVRSCRFALVEARHRSHRRILDGNVIKLGVGVLFERREEFAEAQRGDAVRRGDVPGAHRPNQ
jgi:hypothetical protein